MAKLGLRYVALGSSFSFNSKDCNKKINKDLEDAKSPLSRMVAKDNEINKLRDINADNSIAIDEEKENLSKNQKELKNLESENQQRIDSGIIDAKTMENDLKIQHLKENIDGNESTITSLKSQITKNEEKIKYLNTQRQAIPNEDPSTSSELQTKFAIYSSQKQPPELITLHNGSYIISKLNYPEIKNTAGNKLDTVEILNPKQENTPAADQKWVVYLPSKDDIYQNVQDDLQKASHNTGANILTGNYRGVLNSEGKAQSTKDLVDDARAMIQSLKDKGVPEENIVVQGWSFGGVIGAKAISSFNEGEEKAKMKFVGDRTPSSFGAAVKSFIKIPGPGKLTNAIFKAIGFDTKSADDVKAMDHNNVAFLMGVKDGVVPKDAHVHAKVSSSSDINYKTQEFKDVGHTESSLYASNDYANLIKNLLDIKG